MHGPEKYKRQDSKDDPAAFEMKTTCERTRSNPKAPL